MYHILDVVLPHAPANKPRYLMGVGTPSNIIEGVGPRRGLFRLRYADTQRAARPPVYA